MTAGRVLTVRVLAAICLIGMVAGCAGALGNSSALKILKQRQVNDRLKTWSAGGPAYDLVELVAAILEPPGYFSGSLSVKKLPKNPDLAPLSALEHAKVAGSFSGGFVSSTSEDITVHSVAVATSGASSVCISLTGRSVKGFSAQIVEGSFTVLGGTGPTARLRASGPFLSVTPKPDYSGSGRVTMRVELRVRKTSLGSPRPLTAACRAARTLRPPPPPKVSASLDGFAFAPAGATFLPSGTQLFATGSTVSGPVGCGQPLYAVVTYSGPSTTTDAYLFGPGNPVPVQEPVKTGQNLVRLAGNPANGSYQLKLAFKNVDGPAFTPAFILARSC